MLLSVVSSCDTVKDKPQTPYEILKECEERLKQNPKDPEWWYYQACAYLELKQYEKAVTSATQGIEIDKNAPMLYNVRGDSYYMLKRYSDAKKDFETLHRLSPAWDNALDKIEATNDKLKESAE